MGTNGSTTGIGELAAARAELSARIAWLDGRALRARVRELAPQVDAIRSIADRAGLKPAATVAGLLDQALARGERGALVQGWLPLLRDAVACDRADAGACEAFAAACQVRIAG
jgi:hypothetical protein